MQRGRAYGHVTTVIGGYMIGKLPIANCEWERLAAGNCAGSAQGDRSRHSSICAVVHKYAATWRQGLATERLHICVYLIARVKFNHLQPADGNL